MDRQQRDPAPPTAEARTAAALAELGALAFGEDWYLSTYPDVQAAVQSGSIGSGLDLQYGLSEGHRIPAGR